MMDGDGSSAGGGGGDVADELFSTRNAYHFIMRFIGNYIFSGSMRKRRRA